MRLGGDGIDLSNANMFINNFKAERVSDKAISAGEKSTLKIINAKIKFAKMGIASKDSSNVSGKNISISNCLPYDFAVFRKKNYFKGGNLKSYFEKHRRQLVFSPNGLCHVGDADLKGNQSIKRVYHPEGKAPTLTTMGGGHREPKVIDVKDMTWRKLTPLECERLQTVPDGYTEGVSNTQRYKMLGNGFTVDVIAHILSNLEQVK